jgi:mono/diheme cytochrome c family protein
MIRAAKIIVLVAVVALAALVVALFATVRRGFSAREEPGRVEAFFAKRIRDRAIPRNAKDMQNPVAASNEVLPEAMAHFADHCAICHDNDGSGNTIIGKGLYPKPPDMRQSATQNLTDGELFYIIHNGVRLTGMPAFGNAGDADLDSWKLVHFIRHLPSITPEEVAQMKEMNPRSPAEFKEEEEIKKFLEGEDTPVETPAHKHH